MRRFVPFVVIFTTFYIALAQIQDFCQFPEVPGTGDGNYVRLRYDMVQKKCMPFIFRGQDGNENNFITDKMCMRNCSEEAGKYYPEDESMACKLKKEFGHCMSHYLLWYYDSIHSKCKSFYYSGCGGNGNRFISQEICNRTCTGIKEEGDEPDETDLDTPVGLIIGVVLGIIGAIILIVVIVLAVKSKKPKSKVKEAKETNSALRDEGIEMA